MKNPLLARYSFLLPFAKAANIDKLVTISKRSHGSTSELDMVSRERFGERFRVARERRRKIAEKDFPLQCSRLTMERA